MIIGCIKEVKTAENRVGIVPSGVAKLKRAGHAIVLEKGAGIRAGFSDEEYRKAGAKIVSSPRLVVEQCAILMKVKEPIEKEYALLGKLKGKTLFAYLHLAAAGNALTQRLLDNKITAIAYETVEDGRGKLPLLKPMSQVAGVLSIQYAAQYLQKKYEGRGVSLGKIEHTTPARVVVIGGGVVGATAARTAAGLGCRVMILQRKGPTIQFLKSYFQKELGSLARNVRIVESTRERLANAVRTADVLVGAVLVKGAKAPQVVTERMVQAMQPGAVIVDVAIDQGGCIWGSRPTSHENPIYLLHHKIYCCITNMPGQVPRQATQALTQATLPFLLRMANKGVKEALRADNYFAKGLNTIGGNISYEAVARDLGMQKYFKPFH